ncbi:MAG: LamG domain-containing protein [Planctomycetota bacterium]|nr:MAG: LamG domain-containing protein [Planctomycetota bacterium]
MAIDLSANCVSRWKLNENAADTNVEDSSDNSHDGSSQRNTTLMHIGSGQPPHLNGAFDFNGTDDYITVTDHNDWDFVTQSFTVSFWFKTTTAGTGFFINHRKKGNFNGWDIWMQTGHVWARASEGSNTMQATSPLTYHDGTWYLCTVTFYRTSPDKLTITIYINNVEVDSMGPTQHIYDLSNSEGLCIGSRLSQHAYFDGVMDCIMIFNKLLSSDERAYLYNNSYGTEGLKTACRRLVGCSLGQGKRGLA